MGPPTASPQAAPEDTQAAAAPSCPREHAARYARHLLLPQIGTRGQARICNTSVLVVGAGGTGSPAILYLAAAGFARIGIVDHDAVESSNLQRQIIHSEPRIGLPKAESAARAVADLSSLVSCTPFNTLIDSSNVIDIVRQFDIVVDATDNVATRYLLNDACVILGKTLVSGSALRMDGQLSVYNHEQGPCYRCIFPVPPPPETVTNCNEGGVLNVVPGIIGCMQALEVIKLAAGLPSSYSQKMLLVDAEQGTFRTVKLRGKNPDCVVCGVCPSITAPIDYVQFCGAGPHDKSVEINVSTPEERISCQEYHQVIQQKQPHVLLDVREPIQFEICSLPGSLHIPLTELDKRIDEVYQKQQDIHVSESGSAELSARGTSVPVYVVCRLGNDSQLAVQKLKQHGMVDAKDLIGGLYAWGQSVDLTFPIY